MSPSNVQSLDGSNTQYDHDNNISKRSDGHTTLNVTKMKVDEESVNSGCDDSVSPNHIAQNETKAVNLSKIIVGLVLLGATAAFAVVTFTYTTNQEIQEFEIRVSSTRYLFFFFFFGYKN